MAATTEILIDTDNRSVVKATNVFTDGTQETNVEKFAVADKKGQIWSLTVDLTGIPAHKGFLIGEAVTAQNGNVGYVLDWNDASGALRVVAANTGSTFAAASSITGGTSALVRNVSSPARATARVSIKSIQYSVSPGLTLIVRWEATTNVDAIPLTGSGVLSRNQLAGFKLKNPEGAGTTGDILFSTLGAAANAAYTVILELQKEQGYASRPGY